MTEVFLYFNEQKLLTHAGMAGVPEIIAKGRYDDYNKKRKLEEANRADADGLKEQQKLQRKCFWK